MTIWGVDATYWVSGTALLVSIAAALFSALQWRINARKERRELTAADPLAHIDIDGFGGNGWILIRLTTQRVEPLRLADIEVELMKPGQGQLLKAQRGADVHFVVPDITEAGSRSWHSRAYQDAQGPTGMQPPPMRSFYWFWFSPGGSSATTLRLRISLRSSSLPIRTWKTTVTARLTSEMISAMNAKVSAAVKPDNSDLI